MLVVIRVVLASLVLVHSLAPATFAGISLQANFHHLD